MEFALVVPLVIVLVMAIVEVGLVARTQLEVVNAAREGARRAAVDPDPGRAVGAARSSLGPLGPRARIAVDRSHVVGGVAQVRITLTHTFAAPFFGGFDLDLSARSSMRVER